METLANTNQTLSQGSTERGKGKEVGWGRRQWQRGTDRHTEMKQVKIYPFSGINKYDSTITEAESSSDLIRKIHMTCKQANIGGSKRTKTEQQYLAASPRKETKLPNTDDGKWREHELQLMENEENMNCGWWKMKRTWTVNDGKWTAVDGKWREHELWMMENEENMNCSWWKIQRTWTAVDGKWREHELRWMENEENMHCSWWKMKRTCTAVDGKWREHALQLMENEEWFMKN